MCGVTRYLSYGLNMVDMLVQKGVKPIMVFDGAKLPAKSSTEIDRHRYLRVLDLTELCTVSNECDGCSSRAEQRARGSAFLKEGNRAEAYKCFQRAVDITPEMAARMIARLKERGVEYIVAPYEADAQMAHLAISGDVHAVISEDSDLIAFGCPRVLFKMDKQGNGQELQLKNLGACSEVRFVNWDHSMVQQMCILAGCDYLASLGGLGIKRAHALIHQYRNGERAIRQVRFEGRTMVDKTYETDFRRALMTIRYQRVFDRRLRDLVHLHALPEGFAAEFGSAEFLGPLVSAEVACKIADGLIDPDTHEPFPAIDLKAEAKSYGT